MLSVVHSVFDAVCDLCVHNAGSSTIDCVALCTKVMRMQHLDTNLRVVPFFGLRGLASKKNGHRMDGGTDGRTDGQGNDFIVPWQSLWWLNNALPWYSVHLSLVFRPER